MICVRWKVDFLYLNKSITLKHCNFITISVMILRVIVLVNKD